MADAPFLEAPGCFAPEPDDILGIVELPAPNLERKRSLMKALGDRASHREVSPEALSTTLISEILWAGFGVNRVITGGRTAPRHDDARDIDIYAFLRRGIYRYDPLSHRLLLRKAEDARHLTGQQAFVTDAPLNLVYVALPPKDPTSKPDRISTPELITIGAISQNVSLYCAASGLATVIRGSFSRARLAEVMELRYGEVAVLAQSIGKPGS
ncbi:nitroreductase family protein [Paraburkholderia dinghuensis]|uniref:SagB/ThcOx family dehydrogenase n=1 Tax=Paraburkholderia dinghuensis TaxID=2305225 RepID=A0A3N6PRQ9_9BURK|nr:nitroreductase family protein [Paraburkholderia dinghuensis]RQH02116.1 SagB/ThcOx family dehydrogenase [Paraburkholderia dinghuensis]